MSNDKNHFLNFMEEIRKRMPDFEKLVGEAQEEFMKNSPRILICGPTGVGKSSIINKVFREDIADTGVGRPITKSIREYSKEKVPIKILDTPGFELGNRDIESDVLEHIAESCKSTDATQHVHVMWYCVLGSGSRFQDSEEEFLRKVMHDTGIPIILLLTKFDQDPDESEKLKKEIDSRNLEIRNVIMISSKTGHNLDNLVSLTLQIIPEAFRRSFVNAQKANVKEKVSLAKSWLYTYVSGSAITGFSPLPFSDWIAIVPIQIAMMIHIGLIFGIPIEKDLLSNFSKYMIGTGAATIAGRFIANLLKFIPGIGTALGGGINAAVAGSITMTLGTSYIKLLERALVLNIEGKDISDEEISEILENAKEESSK
jgi:small GTP-binding protein